MQRLFVAIDMPPAVNQRLIGLCQGVSGAKWADISHFHLTLRFIGDADDGLMSDIELALAEIEAPAFELALNGVGYFPPRAPAKILWAGIEPEGLLIRLRDQVVAALGALGLEPEHRKFAPHITLARFKRGAPSEQVAEFLSRHALFRTEPFPANEFHLYSSLLRPDGALHRIEASYPLVDVAAFGG
ncbi:MAG: RNA 2',3'-cyclic phosphodiesterase [Rhodospirillaceae bacterium]|jgi:2'-5' RNA ligase|nr:RNA 2',3'-cyclic phosphodiesterase [Rhodospirillaceae bacterium]MBT3627231.1 RNA 2',3'-cyclic phosphodiesterase [Rhodospirillaceae bacterium]MBT3927005.1 RNA 2',3'-cyclic phosphodiesterase [Rhodospirillaceae bacterium]MBT4427088.1 RNA 2',3'-cyclic phosphodiesterase [Rhodospirillaceae bacterium]MBT5038861.1 RNA 2',3'-cyclic phosphodiesterase [Rhodospirillaceae bacterium]